MFHCYTGTLRQDKLPLPCSVLWLDNCMIVKTCIRNITGEATTPVHKEKNQPKGSWRAFLSTPTFVPQLRKVSKMFLLSKRMLFYPFSFNFCNSESNHITTRMSCISLFGQSLWTLSITWFRLKFSMDSELFYGNSQKKNIVRYCFSFIEHQNPFFHLPKKAQNSNT